MRIVVFSDSHRNFDALYTIMEAQPHASLYLHLGDGTAEYADIAACFPERNLRCVRGNNDWDSDAPDTLLALCGKKRIFLTHGHLYGVRAGLTRLLFEARRQTADIVLYGHTHTAYTRIHNGVYVMNPGSVSLPSTGLPTYGVIDIDQNSISMQLLPVEEPTP